MTKKEENQHKHSEKKREKQMSNFCPAASVNVDRKPAARPVFVSKQVRDHVCTLPKWVEPHSRKHRDGEV